MNTQIKSCYIYSDDTSLLPIYLPDEAPVIIGRSVETKITNSRCSRKQVRLYASYATQTVSIQQLGSRSSCLNGFKVIQGSKIVAKHGDCLEVLYGSYPYRIEFNPPPSEVPSQGTSIKKRACTDSDAEDLEFPSESSNKKRKTENTEEHKSSKEGKQLDTVEMNVDKNSDDNSLGESEQLDDLSVSEKPTWEEAGSLLIYTSAGVRGSNKVAAYDMDNTLIRTESGLIFPKDHNDWQILNPTVTQKLKELHKDGYKIVIFTNQGKFFLGKIKPSDFKRKIEKLVKNLKVPVQVFLATGRDLYRKPRIGMWEKFVNDHNDGVPVDKSKSFFVGDAAGRAKNWAPKKKKDHSLADRLMALNLDLTFYTPEEHFLGHSVVPYVMPAFNPRDLLSKNIPLCEPSNAKLTSMKQEVILMVGGPGTGKTFVAKTYLTHYHHINRDKLGSWQKCVSALENALAEGKSVVIDNTNPDVPSRQRYVDVAKAQSVPIRCFVMTTTKEHAKHNNKFRELTDPSHMTVTDVIINSYSYTNSTFLWRCTRFLKLLLLMCLRLFTGTLFTHVQPYRKNYVPPNQDEGFNEIIKINFVPRFTNNEHRKIYEMYLLER